MHERELIRAPKEILLGGVGRVLGIGKRERAVFDPLDASSEAARIEITAIQRRRGEQAVLNGIKAP